MKPYLLTACLIFTIVQEVGALRTTIEKAYIDAGENVQVVLISGEDNQLTVDGRCEDLKFDQEQQVLGWVQRGIVEDDKGNVLEEFRAEISIYKNGHFKKAITTGQTIWNWKFLDNGKKIVYGSGPTHGRESYFELYDIENGRPIQNCSTIPNCPDWASDL